MTQIYRLLGWLSLILMLVLTAPYWLRKLNSWTFKTKNKKFLNFIKLLRKPHKALGIALGLVSLAHGLLMMNGQLKLHTGSLAYLGFFATVILGGVYHKKRGKKLFLVHKAAALISALLLILHLVKPWALGQWFGLW